MDNNRYYEIVKSHYETVWQGECRVYLWDQGPIEKLEANFRVLEFPPTSNRKMWTYATIGMSSLEDTCPLELHLFSSTQDENLIELLQITAFYHKNVAKLNLHHTINFGRSWQQASKCTHGYISLPYLDGPRLEDLIVGLKTVKFYWLIPITEREVEYKRVNGVEKLEELFDMGFNYIDNKRVSLI